MMATPHLLLPAVQDLPEDAAAAKRKPLLALIREIFNEYFRVVRWVVRVVLRPWVRPAGTELPPWSNALCVKK